ncbi:MAG: glycosyltransferase 87 family protein, partial [Dehalococcoidia bacterium]
MVFYRGAFADDWEGDYSILVFYNIAEHVFAGDIPYRDFTFEYPPIALPVFLLPRLFTSNSLHYQVPFAIEMLIFDLIGLLVIADLSRRLGRSPRIAILTYTIVAAAGGPLITERFDVAPAVLVLCAIYAFIRRWHATAWILLCIAIMLKTYPIVIAPLFAMYFVKRKEFNPLVKGIMAFGITLAIIVIPCLCLDVGGFIDSYTYHFDRGLQIESTYASVILLGSDFGLLDGEMRFDYGAWHMDTPLSDSLSHASFFIMLLVLAIVYALYTRHKKSMNNIEEDTLLINYAVLAVLAFMLTSKVLSPQYIIWIYPLIPAVAGQWRIACIMLFVNIGVLTYYIYPENYGDLLVRKSEIIYILFARNVLLLILPFGLI